MELQQLRYALAVVEHGTFTAAAEACFVAQPSLSHAIRTLERDLGVELFHRIGRRAQLTSAGEAFVPAARQVLRAVDAVRAEVGAVVDLITGRLDLVALPTLAVDPVATLVGAFRKALPRRDGAPRPSRTHSGRSSSCCGPATPSSASRRCRWPPSAS